MQKYHRAVSYFTGHTGPASVVMGLQHVWFSCVRRWRTGLINMTWSWLIWERSRWCLLCPPHMWPLVRWIDSASKHHMHTHTQFWSQDKLYLCLCLFYEGQGKYIMETGGGQHSWHWGTKSTMVGASQRHWCYLKCMYAMVVNLLFLV